MVKIPATNQTAIRVVPLDEYRAIDAGDIKIPDPITAPTTKAVVA
jgi:hypothetical protein